MPQIATIDWETYYARDYSLTKLTTEEYVRDPRFEAIGVSFKLFHQDQTLWVPQPDIPHFMRQVNWADLFIVGQNTAFDGAIMAWRYGVQPAGWGDTLGMSRALFPHERQHSLKAQAERMKLGVKGDEVENALGKRYVDFTPEELRRYGRYCKNDAKLTEALFTVYMSMGFPSQELKLIDLTLRMFIDPRLTLDKAQLVQHLHAVRSSKAALIDRVRDNLLRDYTDPEVVHSIFAEGHEGIKKMLMSNDKFAEALRGLGVEPPTKISLKTKKMAFAFAKTDEEFKELAEHPNPDVQALVAARLGNKTTLEETRTERFIGMADRGLFPIPLRYYGAHSGRWSGQESVNMQNLPSRGANAGRIKKAIMAPPGYVVIDCDSAQIEARVLAWLAGQEDLVQAFRDRKDVYKLMASKVYGIPATEVTEGAGSQRQVGKTVVLGCGYGVGHVKLQAFLKAQAGAVVDLAEAKRIIDTYRIGVPDIVAFWRRAGDALTALMTGCEAPVDALGLVRAVPGKGLTLPSGLSIQYPELRAITNEEGKRELVYVSKGQRTRIYGGKVVENVCQAIARQVVAEQMLRVSRRYKVVLTVHDAVAIIAREEEAEDARAYLDECMSWNPPWAVGLPLACESGVGKSYGDC